MYIYLFNNKQMLISTISVNITLCYILSFPRAGALLLPMLLSISIENPAKSIFKLPTVNPTENESVNPKTVGSSNVTSHSSVVVSFIVLNTAPSSQLGAVNGI